MTVNEPLHARPVFVESEEQKHIRDTVREIAQGYGHRYYLECSRSGKSQTELWADLGRYGFLGVNIPVGVRRRRAAGSRSWRSSARSSPPPARRRSC